MIVKEFITENTLSCVVSICEDTAHCVIEHANSDSMQTVIDFIDSRNYICIGIFSTDENVSHNLNYYLGGKCTTLHEIGILKNSLL